LARIPFRMFAPELLMRTQTRRRTPPCITQYIQGTVCLMYARYPSRSGIVRTTTLAKAPIANNQNATNSRCGSLFLGQNNGEPDVLEPAPYGQVRLTKDKLDIPFPLWVGPLAHRCLMAMQPRMRSVLIASILAAPICWVPAVAQMTNAVPAIGTTSPLGMTADTPGSPAGIPMGATELPSAGLSPVPAGSMTMTSDGVACPSPEISSSATTFDGGGMAMGMPLPGGSATSGTCGTSSTAAAPSSAMATPSPGGARPAGIPLGSVEIGNGGLSPEPVGPVPSPMPLVAGSGIFMPTMPAPAASPPTISPPNTFSPSVEIGGPCTTVGATMSSSSPGC
jgi:hypothetical protein